MKKYFCLFLVLLSLFSLVSTALAGEPLPAQVDIYYFYDEICGSCDGTEDFYTIVNQSLAGVKETYAYTIYPYNVYTRVGRDFFDSLCEALGLNQDSLTFPLVIVGGKVFLGHEAIAKNLKEAYLTAGEDLFVHQRVYSPALIEPDTPLFAEYTPKENALTLAYFYRITCDECNEARPVIDEIIADFLAANPNSPIDLVTFNTRSGDNGKRVSAFFDAYQVPDDKRMVPIVFLANTYLAGIEDISAHFALALEESRGQAFVYPTPGE